MAKQHQATGDDHRMSRKHYGLLVLNVLISAVIMYFVMFSMIWSTDAFVNNINFVYMAVLMATPMGVLMLLMMGPRCPNRRLNVALHATFGLLFVIAFYATRDQSQVGDRQFLRSMIPHHSGALTMCRRASLRDAQVRDLCFGPNGIVESQTREIEEMEHILARL